MAASLPDYSLVLDLGCGDMSTAYRYIRGTNPSIRVIGLERFDNATLYGPSPLTRPVLSCQHWVRRTHDLDAGRLPLQDGSVDGVTLIHVIEHVHERAFVLREAYRVLRPGGVIYLEAPGPASRLIHPCSLLHRWSSVTVNIWDDPTHVAGPFSAADLERMLSVAGFQVLRRGNHREFGLTGMPVYVAVLMLGLLPLPKSLRRTLVSAGYWNLVGWATYAFGRKRQ